MGYINKEIKNIDNVKKQVSHDKNNKPNKVLSKAIILLPIFSLIYLISLNSNTLINKRMSVLTIVIIIVLLIMLIIGIKKEFKIKRKIKTRVIKTTISFAYLLIFILLGILMYGNDNTLRKFIIEKAMSTTNHHYLATWFYNDEIIKESMDELKLVTKIEISANEKINFDDVNSTKIMYSNKYEEEILNHENDTYKIINIKNEQYKGYLVALYKPNNLKLVTSPGENLSTISQKNSALFSIGAKNKEENDISDSNEIFKNLEILESLKIIEKNEVSKEDITNEIVTFENNKLMLIKTDKTNTTSSDIYGTHLIVNNKNLYTGDTYANSTSLTIIGQRNDGIILILVVDSNDNLNYYNIAKMMESYGAINAISLNITSSNLIKNNKYVNGNDKDTTIYQAAWIIVE